MALRLLLLVCMEWTKVHPYKMNQAHGFTKFRTIDFVTTDLSSMKATKKENQFRRNGRYKRKRIKIFFRLEYKTLTNDNNNQ